MGVADMPHVGRDYPISAAMASLQYKHKYLNRSGCRTVDGRGAVARSMREDLFDSQRWAALGGEPVGEK